VEGGSFDIQAKPRLAYKKGPTEMGPYRVR
jgi:hypothetical protein